MIAGALAAAYQTAQHAAIGGAIDEAHEYALEFGPNQFCGTLRQPIFKKGKHERRKVVGTKKVHRCFVPPFAYITLTVTYSAT